MLQQHPAQHLAVILTLNVAVLLGEALLGNPVVRFSLELLWVMVAALADRKPIVLVVEVALEVILAMVGMADSAALPRPQAQVAAAAAVITSARMVVAAVVE